MHNKALTYHSLLFRQNGTPARRMMQGRSDAAANQLIINMIRTALQKVAF